MKNSPTFEEIVDADTKRLQLLPQGKSPDDALKESFPAEWLSDDVLGKLHGMISTNPFETKNILILNQQGFKAGTFKDEQDAEPCA